MTFTIHEGDPASPVILHVPHASRHLPPEIRRDILLDDDALTDELDHLTDAYTDRIARQAADAAAARPWIFENRLSRLAVDPERFPDEREEMRRVGMGAVYTNGHAGRKLRDDNSVRDQTLLRTHFHPYSGAVRDLVTRVLAATGRAVIVDVHSYPTAALPYELHGTGPRPPVCLGTDSFHTPPPLIEAAADAFGEVALNTPYAGCYVPLDFYHREPAVSAVMIEIRRDGYMTEPGGPPHEGLNRLAAALAGFVDTL